MKTPEELEQQLKEREERKALKEQAKAEAQTGKSDTITIERSKVESLLSRLDRLEAAASKAHLAHYDEQHKEKMTKEVRVRTFDGKIVLGERMTKNLVEKTPEGRWREEQEVELSFQDGTKVNIPYVYYIRNYKHITGRVISEAKNMDSIDIEALGDYTFKLSLPSAEIIEVGSKFVN